MSRPELAARLGDINVAWTRELARLFAPAQRRGWIRRDLDLEAAGMWHIAQMTSRAVVELSAGSLDMAEYDRLEVDALLAVVIGEAPDTSRPS